MSTPEPRPLPSFAIPKPRPAPPKKLTKRDRERIAQEARLEGLRKGREALIKYRERKRAGVRQEPLTIDEVRQIMQQDLLPMHRIAADVIKKQMRSGPQAMRYRAVLDWRDTFLGRPNTARQEDDVEGDIVIISPIAARLKEGLDRADGIEPDDAGD